MRVSGARAPARAGSRSGRRPTGAPPAPRATAPSALRRMTDGAIACTSAVADRPARDEAGHFHVAPALAVEKHRQADDEPHIARAEHEHARRRHQVDAARLGEQLAEATSRPSPCRACAAGDGNADQHEGEQSPPSATARRGSRRSRSRRPPTKKPAPFIAFFEPVNQATQRNNCPSRPREVALIADFDAVLVRSLATPAMPCAPTTQATDNAAPQAGIERRQHAAGRRSAG